MISPTEKTILTVSQLNRRVKQLLETHLPLIWVSGEISNLAKPGSGHWYFSLKDSQAQVRCAMFRNANQRVRCQPESGQQVMIRARVSLYEGRGEYQLIAEHMEAAGAGLLQQQYEMLKAKLQAEGLFDEAIKKPLPTFPQCIGIITSATGAAVHDIISVLKRRYPIAPVLVAPVSVQGENAAPEMIRALEKMQRWGKCDVLVIGRGGGSIEDLWGFNDERLARAIARCDIPIVSAVGHEVDFTIADFVADQRAPTPSASAEIISPDLNDWLQTIDGYQILLSTMIQRRMQQLMQQLDFLKQRLRHPKERIASQKQTLTYLRNALIQSISHQLNYQRERCYHQQRYLLQQHPKQQLILQKQKLGRLYQQLRQRIQQELLNQRKRLLSKVDLLNAINPLSVLSRGYAIVTQANGNIVKDSQSLQAGDEISTQLSQGKVISIIKKCQHKE